MPARAPARLVSERILEDVSVTEKISQITPCSGWNYIHKDSDTGKLYIHPVAAWALLENGEVVGLVSGNTKDSSTPGKVASLVQPPPVGGYYALAEG
jgi:hypothetical protein